MNIKINRKTFAILSLSSVTLFSGCSFNKNDFIATSNDFVNNNEENKQKSTEQTETSVSFSKHHHLIINFGNQEIIFRECEDDIIISIQRNKFSSEIDYYIKDANNIHNYIFEGTTSNYNYFDIDNELEAKNVKKVEQELINNGAIVYQFIKK